MLVEGEINKALSNRRMTKGIEELSDHVIVCGFGRAGSILVKELMAAGIPFVVVDQDEAKLTQAEQLGCLILQGNATEDDTLLQAGLERARVLATVVPDDAANVFITLTARVLNPKIEIIARAENPATESKLLRSGATKVVLPAAIGGKRMAQLITHPRSEDLLADPRKHEQLKHELSLIGLEMFEIKVSPVGELVGHLVGEIISSQEHKFLIVALHRGDEIVIDPAREYQLQAGDVRVVLSRAEHFPMLTAQAKETYELHYRGAKAVVTR